jgi:hypothetical protein
MENPIQPATTVKIGGKEFPLRFEHRDFAEAESRIGKPLLGPASIEMWMSGTSAHQTGVLLFTGLLHAMPNLTLDQARSFITYENMGEMELLVTAAFKASLPKKDAAEEPEVEPDASPLAEPTTGSSSGPSASSTSDSQTAPSGG